MFGFAAAHETSLTQAQLGRYRSCYCGLCRSIGRRCGQSCRMALTYDMCFLALLLGSLYEPEEREERLPCPIHPFRPVTSFRSEWIDYAADLNVLLARLNCLDDWEDERRLLRLAEAALLGRGAAAAAERQSAQAAVIRTELQSLRETELRRDPDPDAGANAFGRLMASLFSPRDDRWRPLLYSLGLSLGRFIYIMDAFIDLERDRKRGRYNPLAAAVDDGLRPSDILGILTALMGDCTAAWDALPLLRDIDIQKNILYTGVWTHIADKLGDPST